MGKVSQSSVKYVIEAELNASSIIEKPDVVGAIFGQTEGLLGEELDLRELQQKGKIGRIHVEVDNENGGSEGTIRIPTSLDATNTSLIGASLETIERVGPTNADIKVKNIKDQRMSKRDYIVKRAKQLLDDLNDESPDRQQITEEVKKEVRTKQLTEYKGFEAGPEAEESEELVLVEGRADLVNILKNGVRNGVAMGGTDVPDKISEIADDKKAAAFLDGDRGGDLILKELKQKTDLDFVARAPEGKEVEELTGREIHTALRDKEPVKYTEDKQVEEEEDEETLEKLRDHLDDLIGTRAVFTLDDEMNVKDRVPVDSFESKKLDECKAVVMDAEVDNNFVEKAESLGASYIAGMGRSSRANSSKLKIMTRKEKAAAE